MSQHYPKSVLNLIKNLSRLPGIGEKTATRLAIYILGCSSAEAIQLSQSILDVKEKVHLCSECFGLTDDILCHICKNTSRDGAHICVVESIDDLAAIEKSGAFLGKYHVLHGVLSPMNGIGPNDIKINELLERIGKGDIKEITIAVSTSVEGEATSSYISSLLAKHDVRVTRIASGIPIGSDLKFIDQVTVRRAMERRHVF